MYKQVQTLLYFSHVGLFVCSSTASFIYSVMCSSINLITLKLDNKTHDYEWLYIWLYSSYILCLLTGRKKRNVGHQTVHVSSNTIVVYDQNEGERPPPTSKL